MARPITPDEKIDSLVNEGMNFCSIHHIIFGGNPAPNEWCPECGMPEARAVSVEQQRNISLFQSMEKQKIIFSEKVSS